MVEESLFLIFFYRLFHNSDLFLNRHAERRGLEVFVFQGHRKSVIRQEQVFCE